MTFTIKEVINKNTGEVKSIKTRSDVPFRSLTDLKGFSDNEFFEPGTSLTEPGQDVNIKSVAERCLRGEIILNRPGQYDVDSKMTIDEAFNTFDVTDQEGFDLADATMIVDSIKNDLSPGQQAKAEPTNSSSDGAANPVEKSKQTDPQEE